MWLFQDIDRGKWRKGSGTEDWGEGGDGIARMERRTREVNVLYKSMRW